MKFDMYSLKGRIFPAFISMILPIIIFNHFYVSEELSQLFENIVVIRLAYNISIPIIFLYYLSEFGRLLGKNIFERWYFQEEKLMPTTNFLMYSDSQYSIYYKNKIREKIKNDFGVILATQNEEKDDQDDARKRIVEVMSLIRKKLEKNQFLLQHNIEYGAMRNVIGGSIIGCILSILNILFFTYLKKVELAVTTSFIVLTIYTLLILFSRIIINFYGINYAKILYREYLASNQ